MEADRSCSPEVKRRIVSAGSCQSQHLEIKVDYHSSPRRSVSSLRQGNQLDNRKAQAQSVHEEFASNSNRVHLLQGGHNLIKQEGM